MSENWTPVPCPCGHPNCNAWMVEPVAALQGLGMTREQAHLIAAAPKLRDALLRAQRLVGLLTVRQVLEAGDDAIDAAGLNPYCINEGLADGSERLGASFIESALFAAQPHDGW